MTNFVVIVIAACLGLCFLMLGVLLVMRFLIFLLDIWTDFTK